MEVYQVAIIPLIEGCELFETLSAQKFSAHTASLLGILIKFYAYPRDVPRGILVGLSFGSASGVFRY